jgi:hypothetical protein
MSQITQKIIGIVGPTQSGSTMLYNMVRLIYEKSGYSVDSCFITHFYLKSYNKNAQILIVKCHDYDYELDKNHDLLLLPIRDFRDCALSWKNRYKSTATDSDIINSIINNISRFKCWEHKSFILRYEDYKLNCHKYLDQLLFILGVNLSKQKKDEIIKEVYNIYNNNLNPSNDIMNDPNQYEALLQDEEYKKTLTTQNHNTSNGIINKYKLEMGLVLQSKISKNKYITEVLKQFGYSC